MPRVDPSENGGLFIGRRPGTRPVRYRGVPAPSGRARRRVDAGLGILILAVMSLICLSFWGPLPAGWLWIGSQVQYVTDNVVAGLLSAFIGLMATLILGLVLCKQLDAVWIIVRRAAGHDQRQGMLARVFAVCSITGGSVFVVWLLFFSGARLSGGTVN